MASNDGFELQGYFDDLLLTDGGAEVADQLAERQPAPQHALRQAAPEVAQVAFADADLEQLEQAKRDKLQALLDTKPLAEPSVPDIAVPAAAPIDPTPAVDTKARVTAPLPPETPPKSAPTVTPTKTVPRVVPAEENNEQQSAAANEQQTELLSQYLQWHENGRPHWAQSRFDALLFDVAGLTLAVPLIALGQIQPLTDELSPLFGQAEWFMGLLPTPAGKIRTVNTALFVMPERYDAKFVKTARYVVSIDGVPWGLAVDAINQPISLDPDDVKWRSERGKRPWLAGTVKSAMCALIDIPQMGEMLMQADKNRRR